MPGFDDRKPDNKKIKEIIKRILEDKRKRDLKDYGSQLPVRRQMMQDKFELMSIGHL